MSCLFLSDKHPQNFVTLININALQEQMSEQIVEHMHKDIETLKKDIAVIKHILSEEGKLSQWARKALDDARRTPNSEFISHDELKKRVRA